MTIATMQDFDLRISTILEHGRRIWARSEILSYQGSEVRRASFAEIGARAHLLAKALARLGIAQGDRVGTLAWNCQEHLEAYLAVPSMGAVLHTLNLRLFPEQLSWVIDHAADRVLLVEDSLIPVLVKVAMGLPSVEAFVVIGSGDTSALEELEQKRAKPRPILRYDALLAAESGEYAWPALDERSAAAMCYTSGTTGDPKGVVYSHRSTYLHSMAIQTGSFYGLSQYDRVLTLVPMFHANAWGWPYAAFMAGADLLLPNRFLSTDAIIHLVETYKPTFAAAVPTIWNDVLHQAEGKHVDLSSLRMIVCGGAAAPRALMEAFEQRFGIRIIQAWGMTETSPLGTVAHPPRGVTGEQAWRYRAMMGRPAAGVELRLVDDTGRVVPWDGESVGEIQVRGPWITGSYYKDPAPEKFDDGWLRTGDVGSVDELGFMLIRDRSKDVIKSGGEWISSVELEGQLMAHPGVLEAAVIGVPDEKWSERPLACVVRKKGSTVSADELRAFLRERVASWWIPERFTFIEAVPRTSVGKFDKKALRAQYADGKLSVETQPRS
ncbi:MAG TPA: long-chain fatty acid--CoA ligase [Polyangiales bacterium]